MYNVGHMVTRTIFYTGYRAWTDEHQTNQALAQYTII